MEYPTISRWIEWRAVLINISNKFFSKHIALAHTNGHGRAGQKIVDKAGALDTLTSIDWMKHGILRTKFHFLKFGTNAVRHKGNKESKTIPLLAHI